jgi:hypothetical protein
MTMPLNGRKQVSGKRYQVTERQNAHALFLRMMFSCHLSLVTFHLFTER